MEKQQGEIIRRHPPALASMPHRLDRHAREDEHAMHMPVIAVFAIAETAGMADAEDRLTLRRAGDDVSREAEGGGGGGSAFEQFQYPHTVTFVITAQQCQQAAFRAGESMQLLTELSKLKKSVRQVAAPLVRGTVFLENSAVECSIESDLGKIRCRMPCLGYPEHR